MATRLGQAFVTISGRLDKLTADLVQAQKQTASAIAGMQAQFDSLNLSSGISGLSSLSLSAAAATTTIAGLVGAAGMIGTKFNETVESSTVGIAALLSSQGKFKDSQGVELSGREKINAAIGYSSELVKQLQVDNLKTTATFEQLLNAFQVTLAPGISAGLNVDQVRQYTLAMVQAAAAMQVPLDQMAEETRSLINGTITPRNTRIATALGITSEDVRKWQGDASGWFTWVMGKLEAFKQFGGIMGETFSGLVSNSKDAVSNILGAVTKPFFEDLKGSLKEFYDYAVKIDNKTGNIVLNPELISSVQLLNDSLGATLTLAEGIVKALSTVGTVYSSIKSFGTTIGSKKVYDGASLTGVVGATDEARLERVKQLMDAIASNQREISNAQSVGWFRTATEEFNLIPALMAKVRDSFNIPELEMLRTEMSKVGQDTTQIDAFLNSLKQIPIEAGYTRDGMDRATIAMRDFGFYIDKAGMSADVFKKHLQEIAHINLDSIGEGLSKSLVGIDAKIEAALSGAKSPIQNAAAKYSETMAELNRAKYEAEYSGAMPDVLTGIGVKSQQAALLKWKEEYLAGVNEANKEARKVGPAPIDYTKIDQDILKFKERMGKLYQGLYDLDMNYEAQRLEASGQFYEAEEVRMAKKVSDQKAAYAKEVADTQQAYLEMQQKLAGKKGATPEAIAAVSDLKDAYESATKRASEYGVAAGRNARQELSLTKQKQMLSGGIDLAQTNVSYAQLTGTMEEQYRTQIALIQASRDEKLANVNKNIPGLVEAYQKLYAEQERTANLHANGSFFDGMREGLAEINRELPTTFDSGKAAIASLKNGISDAAGTLADFVVTGKMDFSSFASSIIRDLIKIQIQAMLLKGVSGLGSIFGSIFGMGSTTASASMESSFANSDLITEGLFGFAEGGDPPVGQWVMVGEQGPELLKLKSPGTVVPNNKIGSPGQGQASAPPSFRIEIIHDGSKSSQVEEGPTRQEGDTWVKSIVMTGMMRDESFRKGVASFLPKR